MRRRFRLAASIVAVLIVIGGGWLWLSPHRGRATVFRTAEVKRGDISASISATGTVEPEVTVDVGAQVTGVITSFGRDVNNRRVDYRSVVKKGGVLAHIDPTVYADTVDMDKAELLQARANVVNARANLALMKAELWVADANWRRALKLGPSQALAPTNYDQYKANYLEAKANVRVAAAQVDVSVATVAQNMAQLKEAEANLAYCTVTSPVAGVVVDRRVNIGQTIVSSTATSSLFLIAQDLKRIQVWASVNEADIGHIYPGQPVDFTVDAFGNKVFHGVTGRVRLNATMSQNVVTYTVEVNCDNSDGKLLPYLTTNLQFEVGGRKDVLLVPNAALRWTPEPALIAYQRNARALAGRASSRREGAAAPRSRGVLWVARGNFVRPVRVSVGLTDGVFTQVSGRGVAEGLEVVTGVIAHARGGNPSQTTNPFIPQIHFFHGGGGGHH